MSWSLIPQNIINPIKILVVVVGLLRLDFMKVKFNDPRPSLD